MSHISDEFIDQMKQYFHKLTSDYMISTFGKKKSKSLFINYDSAFDSFYHKSLSLMPTNMSKRHGINSIFVLALDKALENEKLSFEELKDHVIAIYKIMMMDIFENQAKKLEKSENPWHEFVEIAKKGNKELYENEYFNAKVTFDLESVFGIDIHRCLYFEILREHKRQDLGPILCEYDFLLTNTLDKWIRFERTATIAKNYSRCEFRYYPKEYLKKNKLYENLEKIKSNTLAFVHEETGWGNPLKPQCEFEDFYIRGIKELEDDKLLVSIEYHFDEDGFSMYPRMHILEGTITLDNEGSILESRLIETYTDPACVEDPYKLKKDKP